MEVTPAQRVRANIEDDVPVADRTFVRSPADRRIRPMFLFRALSLQGTHPTVMVALGQPSSGSVTKSTRRSTAPMRCDSRSRKEFTAL